MKHERNQKFEGGTSQNTLRHPSLSKRIATFSTAKCSIDTNHHENFVPLVSFCWRIGWWGIHNLLRGMCSRELLLKHRNWLIQWSVVTTQEYDHQNIINKHASLRFTKIIIISLTRLLYGFLKPLPLHLFLVIFSVFRMKSKDEKRMSF